MEPIREPWDDKNMKYTEYFQWTPFVNDNVAHERLLVYEKGSYSFFLILYTYATARTRKFTFQIFTPLFFIMDLGPKVLLSQPPSHHPKCMEM